MLKKQLTMAAFAATFLVAFSSCDEEDPMPNDTAKTGSFTANNQTVSQNTVVISEVTLSDDGFVVIHRDNGSGGPVVPDIMADAVALEAGTHTDVEVSLEGEALTDGESLWVMLHTDDGTKGTYEFDGANGFDGPVLDADGNIVMSSIEITAPSLTVNDQAVNNNQIVIAEVNAAADGWLVVHNDDGTGNIVLPDIIGKVLVSKGINTNVTVDLDASETYTSGQFLFPMLHLDNGTIGEYEFDGVGVFDGPEIFSNDAFPGNVIFTSFTVQ